ncbi:hypothetical protein BaRGS_00002969, partial [Batillaria attramentaria]
MAANSILGQGRSKIELSQRTSFFRLTLLLRRTASTQAPRAIKAEDVLVSWNHAPHKRARQEKKNDKLGQEIKYWMMEGDKSKGQKDRTRMSDVKEINCTFLLMVMLMLKSELESFSRTG